MHLMLRNVHMPLLQSPLFRGGLSVAMAYTIFLGDIRPAAACDVLTTVRVIGFDDALTSAVLHVAAPPLVRIEVVDLQEPSRREVFEIVTQEEAWAWQDLEGSPGRPDLDAIRARRWTELEPKLQSRGFKPLRPLPMVDEKTEARMGFKLELRESLKQSSMQLAYDLLAVKDSTEVLVIKQFMSASSGKSVLQGVFLLRGKAKDGDARERLFVVGDPCFEDPPRAVLSVQEVRDNLENHGVQRKRQ